MDFDFQHYLLAKQTVDDRALNRRVYEALTAGLPSGPLRVVEVGAGIGTMARRLVRWGLLKQAEYVAVDGMEQNIGYACQWVPAWARDEGLAVEEIGPRQFRLQDAERDINLIFEQAEVFEFIHQKPAPADLLIAHAFLDLLPMPESLPRLLSLTRHLAWLTVNFDGLTSLEPAVNPTLDETIERLYHRTMDTRATGGDSRAGRHLFSHLQSADARILAAGASDWAVFPRDGAYPADEKYFLSCILHFFEESLTGHKELDADAFAGWLAKRRAQIERGELVYIAHQMDFLVKTSN